MTTLQRTSSPEVTLVSLPVQPTETATPTATRTPTRTSTATATTIIFTPAITYPPEISIVVPTLNPIEINDIPVDELVVFPPGTAPHIREIYAHGQALGRNPAAFSKLGDSTIEQPHFLDRFDGDDYNLGEYAFLQPVIDNFHGSFGRESSAVKRGLHTWSVFDPLWATGCEPNETMLDCEIRQQNPVIIFIHVGTNDVGAPERFRESLNRIVETCIEQGVIPLLGTKADRNEGASNRNNIIIREVAAAYRVPLWDFDRAAETLPRRGLTVDGVHLTTFYAHDYRSALAMQRGYSVHNLIALLMLERVWQEVK